MQNRAGGRCEALIEDSQVHRILSLDFSYIFSPFRIYFAVTPGQVRPTTAPSEQPVNAAGFTAAPLTARQEAEELPGQ